MTKKHSRSDEKAAIKRKKPEQIPIEYAHPPSLGLVEGTANRAVLDALRRAQWATGRVAIIGAEKSGKSTLALRLAGSGGTLLETPEAAEDWLKTAANDFIVIDDIEDFVDMPEGEARLFHILNELHERQGKLVIFSCKPLHEIEIALPDLRSRLGTFEVLEIAEPDDDMVLQLLAKGFEERGVFVKPDVLRYLSFRVGRSYVEIARAVEALDLSAIRDKSKINKAKVKSYFEDNP